MSHYSLTVMPTFDQTFVLLKHVNAPLDKCIYLVAPNDFQQRHIKRWISKGLVKQEQSKLGTSTLMKFYKLTDKGQAKLLYQML